MKRFLFLAVAAVITLAMIGCNKDPEEQEPEMDSETYNELYRVFPSAPAPGSVTYEYFDEYAPVRYWNEKGHNHRYPDPFMFMDGTMVKNISDWEKRRKEISLILQYYMHGRMPSIAEDELEITWSDSGNTCIINLKHIASGRKATFNVAHLPPAGATEGSQDRILLFGVGNGSVWGGPPAAREGWGTALFNISWGGSESNRGGTCATLYGLSTSAYDTPSVNMEYAWAMSVILTVIEEGGFKGYYDPDKVGIYGFSRWGKAAMIIGAFAEGRKGNQLGQTFIGSAGSGGPAIDRWISQMGYKNHKEDPLPVDTTQDNFGVNAFDDLKGTTWYLMGGPYGEVNQQVVRGWTSSTPGIPKGSLIYGEYNGSGGFTRNPGPPENWGRIQVLSQARSEVSGWFSARFQQFTDKHSGAKLDRGSGGVLCTMPFDAHFISALIAPRVVLYEDGYNVVRNNPEGQWANWLICDEIYQMYAEEKNDPSIIWRNAIKFYDIEHEHTSYQNQDEYDLVTAVYGGNTPDAKFRTPPFPVDDPRYRWDFNRMDFGRPGHPSIADRVKAMRKNPKKVKAMDTRGLLDDPESLN